MHTRAITNIATLCASGDTAFKLLGNGFFVERTSSIAICFTAAHVIEECLKYHNRDPNAYARSFGHFSIDRASDINLTFLKGFYSAKVYRKYYILNALYAKWDPKTDVGCIIFDISTMHESDKPLVFRLETSKRVELGSDLIALSFQQPNLAEYSVGEAIIGKWDYHLVMKRGPVVAFHPEGVSQYRFPLYEMAIQVQSGDSGSPAFRVDPDGNLLVSGIVSGDLTKGEYDLANTAVTEIASAMELEVPTRLRRAHKVEVRG